MAFLTALRRSVGMYVIGLTALFVLAACNDKPTDLGTDIIPGTDSLYALSSITVPLVDSVVLTPKQSPIFNNTYFLFGKTDDSEARLFIELVNYPSNLPPATDYDVVAAELMMRPQYYIYGDTNDRTLAVEAYELQKEWDPQATWDSIWTSSGATSYYSTGTPQVCSFSKTLVDTADSLVYVPFDPVAAKRWLTKGVDSTLRKELHGFVLLPSSGSSIRQFRNLNGQNQIMAMRFIIRHKDSTDNDTTYMESVVACFTNTPVPQPGELVLQGSRVYRISMYVDLNALPRNAIVLGATARVNADPAASKAGRGGLDELLKCEYVPPSGTALSTTTRRDDSYGYAFTNMGFIFQLILRNADRKGTILISPEGSSEFWRMNRIRLHGANADTTLRPRVTLIYTVPKVLQ
ncbi:MAG: hypothetical protein J0I17_11750 ['Candidatus Kapabacteria' thiocyanatum]|nr:hypothetical protein ['Candidatus Kapabacteria' thiocyanatum]